MKIITVNGNWFSPNKRWREGTFVPSPCHQGVDTAYCDASGDGDNGKIEDNRGGKVDSLVGGKVNAGVGEWRLQDGPPRGWCKVSRGAKTSWVGLRVFGTTPGRWDRRALWLAIASPGVVRATW